MFETSKEQHSNSLMAAAAQDYVLRLFKENPQPKHLYHSYQHTCEVVALCQKIADKMDVPAAERDALLTAAWLHDVGYLFQYEDHETRSKAIAEDFLNQYGANKVLRELVLGCIEATRLGVEPEHVLEEILHDADMAYSFQNDFELQSSLLRKEWQLVLDQNFTAREWIDNQVEFLSKRVRFYTPYAKKQYAPKAAEQLTLYSQLQEKKAATKEKKAEKAALKAERLAAKAQLHPYEKIEAKTPVRGIQSFFRSVYPNHLELSSIADNKANMMISINSIVLTLIIALFSISIGSGPELKASLYVWPIAFFIVTALSSLVIAVLSVMPKVTRLNKEKGITREQLARNLIFFGNFVDISVQEYEQLMQEVFNDSKLLYGNMTRDLYHLGQVLQRKYKLLSLSYTVFLIGLTISVITFLITAFL